jgi:hypothetical protein
MKLLATAAERAGTAAMTRDEIGHRVAMVILMIGCGGLVGSLGLAAGLNDGQPIPGFYLIGCVLGAMVSYPRLPR